MNKRQIKKMSRAAADWMIEAGRGEKCDFRYSPSFGLMFSGQWVVIIRPEVPFLKSYEASCIGYVNGLFINAVYRQRWPKGYTSMSLHKRLLFAINYLKTHATN